ncbi:hypothetical protein CYI56_01825 [Campylobacter upsaliensis]|nr:hypothetical protein [Campylobacter upsaliensis]EAJ5078883.1 hypothetical protein [Campylobacter upsaliensis]
MEFNFNFEAFEQSGKEKNEAINYLKSLNSSIDFDKLEEETKGDENAIYEALKGGNFSFSKPSIEQTRQKLLKNKENEALKAEFNAATSWLGEEKKQNFNFYDFKKAKEKANSKQGLIQADLKEKERQMQKKEALFETRLKERGIIAKSFDDMLDQSGAYLGADLLEKGLNKLGFKDENYIFESEKEDIKSRALKSVREKLERGDLEFNEREKHALRSKYDELGFEKALEKEKERLRLSQKSGNFSEAEREFIENDLGFFNTLFNDDKENIKEFKEKVKSEGVISSEIIKAANTLKAFDEGNLFKNMLFADEKEKKEFQQNFLNDAYKIAELSGFDDVGLDKKGELYFIKDEQKYLVNTGFFDNFAQLLNDTKFEFAGGVLGGLKGFNSGKSAKGKVAKSILGAAAGSFGGAFLDAKIADMYLNRESDFKKNLDFAIQAGLLSMAGDGVILSVKPLAKGLYKGVKKGGEILGEYSILGTLKTLPEQNIQAAEKIIDEVFSPKMKEELKAAQEEFGGSVRGEDLKNAFFANLQKKFTQKYGENDSKTKSVAKIAEIFNTNSLKTRQQAMLDLVRSDTHGSTLAYLLEIAKDDVKIQSNLKNMLNLASSNVEKNLKNLNINPREIKHILDEFEAGNKAAFKEVESQISKLYDENYRVVLSKGEYENIKEEFRQNGVNLEEMTPFLRDLEANVFNENGVTFTQLNNFRKNLNFYIFNKDKTPNFINTLKKIGENILKNEIDKGIDNIFSQNKAAYESIKELYSTSLKDYATLKSLNESIKNLKLQDSAKSADEVLNSLIKYAKGQGEKGVNNLQKIKDYLGEENNAFLEMQILNKLFKESVVENDRAGVRVFDSESFLGRVRELVGENELYERKIGKEFLEELSPSAMPKQISIDEFLNTLENFKNKENFLKHIEKDPKRKDYLNLIEPTLKEPDIAFKKLENGVEKEKFIKKFSDGKDFFYLLATKDNKETILTAFKTDKINTILKEFNADIIPTFIRQGSKGKAAGTTNEGIITQPLFKSKEAREFLELVEGFHKLYKNDASIAKNLVQGTASQLSTSIATSAEGAIKQKVVKGGFDPIFRLLPDGILFGLFSKQIQGGALRYHLKKALSRSLNYDDFKIKLEKELKRTNFNSNTSRLIDEFMQNLEDFNREKEQFLEAKRIEQARIKEEERKRAEEKPLKDEFGVNFEGFKGKEAIEKLLEEQRGQVKGAFYKEGLGEIDLVWGDKNYGLEHILNKHGGEFENLARELSEAVENGKIVKDDKGRLRLEYENKIVGIKDNWKGEKTAHWVVTAYVKKEKEASLYTSASFTKGEALPLNSNESIAQKAKNDEVLEAEVIEEASLNEPMKFLEFQQRKLLTYIKENTPLRLLEHKKELKTRDILNFLEQSALNGKQKVFLMRNLERDLGKLELKIKENESVKAKIKNTYEISQSEAKELGEHFNFKGKKPLLRELRENEIKHALKSHGNKESEEARGNIAIALQDIEANYPKITQEFDEKFFTQKGVIYVKQVNGHHIVIEEALSGQDKLIFKTMWKTKGNYNKEVLLKNAKTSPYPQNADEAVRLETISKQELEQSNPQQSHLSTDESIAQNSEKLPFETQTLDEDKLSGDEVRLLANKIGEKSTMAYFKDYLLKMDKNFHARAKDIIREYYKIEPFRKELENQWENVKAAYKNGEMSLKEFKFLSRYKDEKSFLNQVAGVLWLQNDGFVKKRGYTYNEYGEIEEGRGANYYNNLALEYGKAQTALKKWFYYIQKANKQAQRFFNKKELEDLRANEKGTKLEAKGSEDIIFTDTKGKEHTLTKETQKAWLEAFNLKSLEEAYIPNLPSELKEALGKEIKLTKGSLYKIVEKGREKYIPQMKQTLQNPDFALRDRDNMLILAKQIEDKQYFTSVNLETKDYFISVSNAPKKENILKNKVENGAEILYQSPNAKSIFYTDTLLQTDKSSANKIDEDIIAQNAKSESEKEVLERQIPLIEAEIQKYEAKIASLDERIKKTQTRIQPYLDEINALQKQYDELYFTETRGEEANAKKWLKLEEIKAKQEELRKPYNDALFKFVFPHQRLKGKVQTEIQKLKFGLQDRVLRLGKFFASVSRNDEGEWIIRSNAPKSKNGLNNKILNGGKEIYNDQAASQINASNPYDDIANSNIKLDNESIAQNSHYLELVKEYGEENAKRIIKQKILGENIAQVLENKEEKFIYKKGDREFEFKIKDAMGQFEMQYDELNLKSDLNKSFLKALNKLKIGYEVLENEPVRIRYFKQEAKERKPKETKPSANKTLGQIQKDMSARLKELKAQAKENYERYKNEDKALQKELTNTKDLFKAFEKEFNETEGTILISRAKRRKNDAEGKVETSVFLGNELALRNALDRWERYSGYSEENALEVKERLELLRSYVKRLEKHREDIKAKREQLEQDYQQNEAPRSKEMGVIGNYKILSNLKGVSENELYEPFLEKVGGYLSKADFYERHLPFAREEFQKLFNITPLKEFGTNYAEFYRDGKGAVEKLLAEKQGQVAGAFYKEGLGEIDLVWGDENFGLRHIIDKHGDEFEDIAAELDEIIAKGVLEKGEHRYFIKHNDYKGMIALDYKGKESNAWILTLYKDKSALNPAYQHQIKHNTNTSSETRANGEFENFNIKNANLQKEKVDKLFHGDAEVISAQGKFNELEALNLTDEDIIPQQKIKFAMEKFHYDEKKAKDLLEWHKNSHALTKDENGLPKVFYHGSGAKFEVFEKKFDEGKMGFFFADREILAEDFAKDKGGNIIYPAFLKIKNPIWLSYEKQGDKWVFDWLDDESKKLLKEAQEQGLSIGFFQKDFKFKDFLISRGYDGIVVKTKLGGRLDHVVFDSNQIKHIDNKGSFTDTKGNVTSKKPKNKEAEFSYFNEKSDNIYHSNPHLGAGLVGGVLNGVEQDENGNLSFDPVKFAMGFLGGSGGSFALKKGFQILEKNPELKEKIINELSDTLAQGFEKAREKYSLLNLLEPRYIVKNEKGRKIQAKTMLKELEREQKGLYNVAFNGKNAVLIKKDLEAVDEAILFEKGRENAKTNKGYGAKHILKHTIDKNAQGYITDLELVNIGKDLREFLKNYEPFIDTNGARLYEWEKEGVRFRLVVGDIGKDPSTTEGAKALSLPKERIITFYSDRNLKEKMNFKNPLLKDTIAQASMQGEALSKELEKSFLDESGRIAYKSLMQNAEKLPKELNLRAFKEQFKGQKYAIIKTPIKDVKINTDYAFYHLLKSGNGKENRKYISGGILATLQNPLFVTKDERGSYYFYKPFKINENLINLVSVEVDKNDKLLYKTSYEASKNKLKSMIEKYDLIYFAGGIQPVRAE